MVEARQSVLITGITGYLGSWVAKYFLDQKASEYRIIGTVRDPKNQEKLEPLKLAFGEETFSKLELIQMDLLDAVSINKAIEGIDYVVHVASPIYGGKKLREEEDIIKPAVEGIKAVMDACLKHKVKRLVVTGALFTIGASAWKGVEGHYDERDWVPEKSLVGGYQISKYR